MSHLLRAFAGGDVEFAEGQVDCCARLPLLSRLERWCGVCGQELGRELGAERVVDGFDRLAQAANILGMSTTIPSCLFLGLFVCLK